MSKKNDKKPAEGLNIKAETTESAKPAVDSKKEEPAISTVYLGPSILKIVKHGTIYGNGILPEQLEQLAKETPAIMKMIVPVSELNATLIAINKPESAEGRIYRAIKEKYKEVR